MTTRTSPFADRRAQLAGLIVPCIDVAEGRTSEPSGVPGLSDPGDVLSVAERYVREGADKLFLDVLDDWDACGYLAPLLSGLAATGASVIVSVQHGTLPSVSAARSLLRAGADALSVSTSVIEDPDLVREAARRLGGRRLLGVLNCAADGEGGWVVCTHGGSRRTGVRASSAAATFGELGVAAVIANSLDREGTSSGYDIRLTHAVAEASGLPTIASGGAGSAEHLSEALASGDAAYVLVNKMVHSGKTSMAHLCDDLLARWSFDREAPCAP
ncbi:hypothetical protein FM076_18170 [Streptomyces albus subsp. chlorinus]|uniref:HisA/HisF-related TIM barrel protein n=1 Tax=Streptomyces albus TaxID=1888 RepID=UPI00157131DC|nr:HisA/HisF-related TIM barrel protein [Streptomyces albus]NSC22981.1 hypothetical protein [Streptomyces albus subsp. chlorinus]